MNKDFHLHPRPDAATSSTSCWTSPRRSRTNPEEYRKELKHQVLAMIFEKPSLRTRMTFEVGMLELGGKAIYLSPNEIQLGKRETVEDVAHNLERWVDGIMIRTFAHDNVVRLAKASSVPGHQRPDATCLHPCQAMADFFTLSEHKGAPEPAQAGLRRRRQQRLPQPDAGRGQGRDQVRRGHAQGLRARPEIVKLALEDGKDTGFELLVTNDPAEAVKRRGRHLHRRLGLDGPGGGEGGPGHASSPPTRSTRP